MLDCIMRAATLYDGTGNPARTADVGIQDGNVVEIGRIAPNARTVVPADGLALMPGIVDVHTHYDAQVTWDPKLSPSVALGVTTAIMGNCGFGLAPCPPAMRETLLRNLSVVEGMDVDALLAGVRWNFETFPEYLDAIERQHPWANVGVLAQHSTIRTAVLGDVASTKRTLSSEDLEAMQNPAAPASIAPRS